MHAPTKSRRRIMVLRRIATNSFDLFANIRALRGSQVRFLPTAFLKMKEKIKKELKEVPIQTWIILIISLILVAYFIFGEDNKIKLFTGGSFLLIHGILFSRKENKFAAVFEIISGFMALLTLILPKQPLFYLFIFYSLVLLMLLGFLYIHRKMRLYSIERGVKNIYRLSSILLFLLIGMIVIVMMNSVISFGFQRPLPIFDYILFIQIAFISIITFFLLFDNIILFIPSEIRESFITKQYSAAHSFFLSLCLTILIGGYFYINTTDNLILQKIFIVLGVAFFTSLVISDTLKNLFR